MSAKKLTSLFTFLALCTSALAQTAGGPQLVSVLHPSPNVMAMQKYGDIPVSAYNDELLQSILVYTKDNQGNLSSLPVKKDSLLHHYFTSADVTNKYSSSVGNPLERLKLTGRVENGAQSMI